MYVIKDTQTGLYYSRAGKWVKYPRIFHPKPDMKNSALQLLRYLYPYSLGLDPNAPPGKFVRLVNPEYVKLKEAKSLFPREVRVKAQVDLFPDHLHVYKYTESGLVDCGAVKEWYYDNNF